MYKILLTGGSGFFSSNWSIDTKNFFFNFALVRKLNKNNLLKMFRVNFQNNDELLKVIRTVKPNIIIHNAALTDVDKCEQNKRLSNETNFKLTKKIVTICKNEKIKLIFISSDQVFSKNGLNKEYSKKSPINFYGLLKSKAENFIQKNLDNYLIIRTNFFGIAPNNKKSFLDFVKKNLEKKKKIYLIEDLIHNPISVHFLIKYIMYLIKKELVGIFHISSNEKVSKYYLGLKIADIFELNKKLIIKSKLSSLNFKAVRPKIMYLNNAKLKRTIKKRIPSIQNQLIDIRNKYYKGYYNKLIF